MLLAGTIQDDTGGIIACIDGHTWGGCCEIAHVLVHGRHRGKSIGSTLVHAAESEAVRRGCEQVVLITHSFHAPKFHEYLDYDRKDDTECRPKGYAGIVYVKRRKGSDGAQHFAAAGILYPDPR